MYKIVSNLMTQYYNAVEWSSWCKIFCPLLDTRFFKTNVRVNCSYIQLWHILLIVMYHMSFSAIYGKEGLHKIWNNCLDRLFSFALRPNGNICISSLSNIRCPTFILHGMKDPLVRECHPHFLHENIKGSKLHIMPNGKHNLHLRYSQEFNTLVTRFLKQPYWYAIMNFFQY